MEKGPVGLTLAFVTVVGVVYGFSSQIGKLVTFNMDQFGDVQPYFLTSSEMRTATQDQAHQCEVQSQVKPLQNAVDFYEANCTNVTPADKRTALKGMSRSVVDCYRKFHACTYRVYSRLESHNRHVSVAFTLLVLVAVLAVASAVWVLANVRRTVRDKLSALKAVCDTIPNTLTTAIDRQGKLLVDHIVSKALEPSEEVKRQVADMQESVSRLSTELPKT